jgi:hypothetical protein
MIRTAFFTIKIDLKVGPVLRKTPVQQAGFEPECWHSTGLDLTSVSAKVLPPGNRPCNAGK